MTLAVWCAIVGILCIVGAMVFALLDSAKLSGRDQEQDEHEQGGI